MKWKDEIIVVKALEAIAQVKKTNTEDVLNSISKKLFSKEERKQIQRALRKGG